MAPNRQMVRNGAKAAVPDDVLSLDLNDLTVNEIEEIEELTGSPFQTFGDPNKPMAKMLRVIGYIVKKRTIPDFTMEMAGKLKIQILDEPDPTKAAGKT